MSARSPKRCVRKPYRCASIVSRAWPDAASLRAAGSGQRELRVERLLRAPECWLYAPWELGIALGFECRSVKCGDVCSTLWTTSDVAHIRCMFTAAAVKQAGAASERADPYILRMLSVCLL